MNANDMKTISLRIQRKKMIEEIDDALSFAEKVIHRAAERGEFGTYIRQEKMSEWPNYVLSAVKIKLSDMGYKVNISADDLHISWVEPQLAKNEYLLSAVAAKALTSESNRRLRFSWERGIRDFLEANIEYAAAQGHTEVFIQKQYWNKKEFWNTVDILKKNGFHLGSIPEGLIISWDEPFKESLV